jgi:hypothetical protein
MPDSEPALNAGFQKVAVWHERTHRPPGIAGCPNFWLKCARRSIESSADVETGLRDVHEKRRAAIVDAMQQ